MLLMRTSSKSCATLSRVSRCKAAHCFVLGECVRTLRVRTVDDRVQGWRARAIARAIGCAVRVSAHIEPVHARRRRACARQRRRHVETHAAGPTRVDAATGCRTTDSQWQGVTECVVTDLPSLTPHCALHSIIQL
jgi:hypothetical protein